MSMNPDFGFVPKLSLGQRFRVARETTRLDQTQFAAELGTTRQTVSSVERGVHQPRPLLIRAWAMRTGVNRTWLETGEAPPPHGDGAVIGPDDDPALPSRLRESNPRPIHYE